MQTLLPLKTPAKSKAKAATPVFDALGIWSLSMGFSAVAMAAIAYFTAGDKTGAAFVLVGAALVVALMLRASVPPAD
jgi:hypothetical protein